MQLVLFYFRYSQNLLEEYFPVQSQIRVLILFKSDASSFDMHGILVVFWVI